MVYYRYSWKRGILLTEGRGRFWKLSELIARNSEAQSGSPITSSTPTADVRDLIQRRDFRVNTDPGVDHIFQTISPITCATAT